jgi:hypothetical protein
MGSAEGGSPNLHVVDEVPEILLDGIHAEAPGPGVGGEDDAVSLPAHGIEPVSVEGRVVAGAEEEHPHRVAGAVHLVPPAAPRQAGGAISAHRLSGCAAPRFLPQAPGSGAAAGGSGSWGRLPRGERK